MKIKITGVFGWLITIAVLLGLLWMCARSSELSCVEQRCNAIALDELDRGRPPDDVIREHAKCLAEGE